MNILLDKLKPYYKPENDWSAFREKLKSELVNAVSEDYIRRNVVVSWLEDMKKQAASDGVSSVSVEEIQEMIKFVKES